MQRSPSRLARARAAALACVPVLALVLALAPASSARANTSHALLSADIVLLPGPPADLGPAWSVPGPRPTTGTHALVDPAALRAALAAAPAERLDLPLADYGLIVHLPHPSGALMPCFVASSPVMEPALAAKFPEMRTYIAQSTDMLSSGRIELTQRGLTGMLREPADLGDSSGGTWMIDLWRSGDPTNVVAYWLRDLPGGGDWTCHTIAGPLAPLPVLDQADPDNDGGSTRALQSRRNVRTAIACTGEYGLHHSTIAGNAPNAADPMAAIVTIVSRTNVVYEMDLAVHFDLVANNDIIIYFDPATDPYPDTCDGLGGSDCSGPVLGVNRVHVRDIIGPSNFDLGHCVTRIAGGVAYLRSVCNTDYKAGGISGIPRGGDADPFSALVVIHEFGHQFGANHTFSGTRGRCGNNANLNTAWEAGTGSSPMGYAGGCPVGDAPPSDNIVQFADPWFHHGSILEMRAFLGDSASACMVPVPTSNNIPEITFRTPDISIPPGTPFTLTAAATDLDGDTLTYSWEQRDNGVRRPLSGEGSEDNGEGSLFRIFPPILDGSRTFPQWSDILSGVPTPGEKLPTVTNTTRRFRVIVRDNSPGAGGSIISNTADLFIPANASPFTVLTPVEAQSFGAGPATVTWSVGGTNLSPISCSEVSIDLSTDNGLSFSTTLGTFANNGSATVDLPAISTQAARVHISGVGEIFFNVSRPFTIGACPGDYNADGIADILDLLEFFDDFGGCENQPAPCGINRDADFNGDTIVDVLDFLDYLDAFGTGC